jgi:hypothetical protein
MSRKEFIQQRNTLRAAIPSPPIHEEFTLYPDSGEPIVMPFDEIDIGNRRLNMLVAMCERKNKGSLMMSPTARAARRIYPVVGAQILQIRDPGGGVR